VTWLRDATAPLAPTITTPESSPTLSNASTFMIAGTCEDDLPVLLTGASTDSAPCNDGTYAFVLSQSIDGSYTWSVHQEDLAGNIGPSRSTTWNRDATAPADIVLTAPSPNPFASGADAVTIAGSCETGATLIVTGDETTELLCENGAFSLDIPRAVNGTYAFALAQRDDANNTSGTVNVQWTRDDVVPAAVTLISPTDNPLVNHDNGFTLSGTCAGANTVELSGPMNASATCNSMSFSFDITSPVDGTFVYTVRQVGAINGFVSDPVTVTWTRDTLTPGTPTVTQPSTNPYASGDTEYVLSGDCEAGATVHLTGDTTGTTTCAGDGTYAFSISSSVDGTFEYAIHQSDAAQNNSAAVGFEWLRDTNIPASPTIDDPGTSPFYGAATPLEISGSCTTGYVVFLQGASTQSETCVGSSYTFSDPKSIDGAYAYSVYQQNPNNLSASTVATLVWHLDRVRPDEVTVTSPAANPYFSGDDTITIAGACEPGSVVDVTGSETLTLPCPNGSYTFQVTRLSNATYNFNIEQTDKAGNTSLEYLFQWVRDATIPATPVIVSPASSPYYSSASSLVISGTCQTGYRVDLTGASTQNMTCASSAFSFTVPGSTDATRTYAIKQTNTLTSLASSETSLTWVRDATAPALVAITQPATNPYTSGDTLFALNGTCELNATVTLSGAQASSQVCNSGTFTFNLSKSTDGTYNYTLVQTDRANNSSGSRSFQWVRNTAIPPTPVLSSPSPNPLVSNGNSITVAGSCAGTNTVNISGSHAASTTCSGGAFSFLVTKTSEQRERQRLVGRHRPVDPRHRRPGGARPDVDHPAVAVVRREPEGHRHRQRRDHGPALQDQQLRRRRRRDGPGRDLHQHRHRVHRHATGDQRLVRPSARCGQQRLGLQQLALARPPLGRPREGPQYRGLGRLEPRQLRGRGHEGLFPRHQRHRRQRALGERWHARRHADGQGHQCRRQLEPLRLPRLRRHHRLVRGRRRREWHGALAHRRHRGRHLDVEGHQRGRRALEPQQLPQGERLGHLLHGEPRRVRRRALEDRRHRGRHRARGGPRARGRQQLAWQSPARRGRAGDRVHGHDHRAGRRAVEVEWHDGRHELF
jgi:hypothetical protein